MQYVRITCGDKVHCVYDLDKVSFASKSGEKSISLIIDGCRQVFDYDSEKDRDRNFDWMVEHIGKKDEKEG